MNKGERVRIMITDNDLEIIIKSLYYKKEQLEKDRSLDLEYENILSMIKYYGRNRKL